VTTHYDVPGEHLVGALANSLKSVDAIQPPEWSNFVKTSMHKEKSPTQPDWWYFRTASVLRKIGINGPIGTERLSRHYSGAKDRGSKPNRSSNGSRKVLRLIMQQLEIAGFIVKSKKSGRGLTPKGQSMLDNTAFDVKKKLEKEMSSLKKY
jgi:small subunit ribosomal protein S19e